MSFRANIANFGSDSTVTNSVDGPAGMIHLYTTCILYCFKPIRQVLRKTQTIIATPDFSDIVIATLYRAAIPIETLHQMWTNDPIN